MQIYSSINSLITTSFLLFFIGLFGIVLNRRNLIKILICIELMLLGINLGFVVYSAYLDVITGQIFAFIILTVAAAESAIGLAIIISYYRVRSTIAIESISLIKN